MPDRRQIEKEFLYLFILFHLSLFTVQLSTYIWKYVSLSIYMHLFLLQKQGRVKGTGGQCDDVRMLHPNLLFQRLGNRKRRYIIYVNNLISKRY